MVGPWTVLAFSRYFDEMAGPYNTATMALARYLPIALAAYIVSMRIRDDQLPMSNVCRDRDLAISIVTGQVSMTLSTVLGIG